MDWWNRFVWGYATDIGEYDDEDSSVDIEITITIGDDNGNS